MDDALPNFSKKYGRIASNTSGRSGVVALLSRYTRCMAVCQLPVVSNQPLMLNSTQVSSTRASESVALSYSIALIGFREGKKRLGRSVRKPSCQWSALDLATDNCATDN